MLLVEWGDGFEHDLGGPSALLVTLLIDKTARVARIEGPKASFVA
jgi:hypothetical protein